MQITNPSFKILTPIMVIEGMLQRIEAAGRTCYKSEDKITEESADAFIKMIVARGHETVIEHEIMSVRVICDRGVTHEMVRHRIATYSQESTRYCNYSKLGIQFIEPSDFELNESDMEMLGLIQAHYIECIDNGRTPQQARYFLPNGLKTEIVMTCNLREWRHFFKLRTSSAAHPDIRAIARLMLHEFQFLIPIIFDDISY